MIVAAGNHAASKFYNLHMRQGKKNVDTVQDLVQRLICFVCRMVFIVFHCSSRFVSCFSQCFGSELAASQLTDLGIPRSPDYVLAVPW